MGNKDSRQLGKTDVGASQLYLCTLATVHHELLATYFHHLHRRKMPKCWKCTATTKDMYLELTHSLQLFLTFVLENTFVTLQPKRVGT